MKLSLVDIQLLLRLKFCYKRLSLPGDPLSSFIIEGTHFTGQVLQQVCAVWPVLQHFHWAHHSQSSGLVESANSTIKTHLAKFVETIQIPWPKASPLVLLNLRSTALATHKLSPFERVTGHPMHWPVPLLIHSC